MVSEAEQFIQLSDNESKTFAYLIRCSRSSQLGVYIQKESTSFHALLLIPCLHTQLHPSYLVPGWSKHVGVGLNHQPIFSRPCRLSGCRFLILPNEPSPGGTASGTELAPALPLRRQRIFYPKVPFHSQYGTKGTKTGMGFSSSITHYKPSLTAGAGVRQHGLHGSPPAPVTTATCF